MNKKAFLSIAVISIAVLFLALKISMPDGQPVFTVVNQGVINDTTKQIDENKTIDNNKNNNSFSHSDKKQTTSELVPYDGPIENIFFHPLIAYPELAFDGDRISKGYDDWFVTVSEFKKILDALYKNNFILVDVRSIFEEKIMNGKRNLVEKTLLLPPGKKPIIISVDDLNYYEYMIENGNVFKLILDEKGDVATYSVSPEGQVIVSRDNELIPILDNFIKEHEDFSLHGAKGIIALTGYQGILGYRTNNVDSADYEKQKAEVLRVVERLKETGWVFASHSYGHPDVRKISYEKLKRDTLKWKNEVEPLIGQTSIYVYPYGSNLSPGDSKFKFLMESGFNVFYGVGPNPYKRFAGNFIEMDRRHIDGIALKTQSEKLLPLFDAREVIDSIRPKKTKQGKK
ncbi:polysaccharide deacetylase family protein [Thermoanaerobacterium sp. DL9XJH110]|uniref:polysaccharide deacetylase family protein n=1 Tax=Thermoanaerobacterium sp. DL9XJH110 TaxID=3386643 RepID=UPI003BB665FD